MSLAFGAIEPFTVAALISRGVLVAAAGVVVVLAILLVFVMVLRGAGSSRRKASGINYDAQQGQVGQPHSAAAADQWGQGAQGDRFAAANQGYDQRYDQGGFDQGGYDQGGFDQGGFDQGGFDQGFGQGRPQSPQPQQAWGQPAQANAAQWGTQDAAAGRWNDPMAPASGQLSGPNEWGGAPQQGRAASPWDAPAAGAAGPWGSGGAQAPAAHPGAGNNGHAASPWDAPATPSGAAWGGQPAAPSQPAWGAQADQGMMQPTITRGGPAGGAGPRLVERKSDGPGREFDLRKDRLTIGRHRESDVFLEDLAVSRLHTTISHDASGRYIVRDENSANGTYVNGQRVTEQQLKDGDEVQVGQTVLVFHQ